MMLLTFQGFNVVLVLVISRIKQLGFFSQYSIHDSVLLRFMSNMKTEILQYFEKSNSYTMAITFFYKITRNLEAKIYSCSWRAVAKIWRPDIATHWRLRIFDCQCVNFQTCSWQRKFSLINKALFGAKIVMNDVGQKQKFCRFFSVKYFCYHSQLYSLIYN